MVGICIQTFTNVLFVVIEKMPMLYLISEI